MAYRLIFGQRDLISDDYAVEYETGVRGADPWATAPRKGVGIPIERQKDLPCRLTFTAGYAGELAIQLN